MNVARDVELTLMESLFIYAQTKLYCTKLEINRLMLFFLIFSDFHDEPTARNATSCNSVNYARMWTPLWRIVTSVADT